MSSGDDWRASLPTDTSGERSGNGPNKGHSAKICNEILRVKSGVLKYIMEDYCKTVFKHVCSQGVLKCSLDFNGRKYVGNLWRFVSSLFFERGLYSSDQ